MRFKDLPASIKRDNNKSALDLEHHDFIKDNYTKEVNRGWMIKIPKGEIIKLKGCRVIPIGIAKQFTINDKGERIEKHHLTHDCSNIRESGRLVNNMVDGD